MRQKFKEYSEIAYETQYNNFQKQYISNNDCTENNEKGPQF